MADFMMPPNVRISNVAWELMSNAGVSRSIFTGAVRSVDRVGDRWRFTVQTENATDRETYSTRAALKAFRAVLRGPLNRALTFDPAYALRGAFPLGELLTNPLFNGVSPWESDAGSVALTVHDRILRATRVQAQANSIRTSTSISTVQWAPYAFRMAAVSGRGPMTYTLRWGTTAGNNDIAETALFTAQGLRTVVAVAPNSGMFPSVAYFAQTGANRSGDFIDFTYSSVSRCAYIDVGVNQFQRSNEIDNAYWTKAGINTVTANAFTGYSGVADAEKVIEDGASSEHHARRDITKTGVAEDWCFAGAFRAGDNSGQRARVRLRLGDSSSTDYVQASFNLTNGTIATAAAAVGAAVNARAFISDLGGGWWYCALIGRTDSETTLRCTAFLEDGAGAINYTGDNVSNIGISDLTVAPSSVPVQLVRTSAAISDGASPTFFAVLKGLPPGVNGLLLPGDRMEIITSTSSEYKTITIPVNTDAAGLGFVKWSTPLYGSALANAPVIFHQPIGRFVLADPSGGWNDRAGGFSDFDFVFEEALDQ